MTWEAVAASFGGQLEEIFDFLRERIDHSAGKLMGSLGDVEQTGQKLMSGLC